MILTSLTLQNFGSYGGRQSVDLTPAKKRPIILFGGLNGGGKTTILDAVQLALYGSRARVSNRGRMAYRDYLRQTMHRGPMAGDAAAVALSFVRMVDGEPVGFDLERRWSVSGENVKEQFEVRRDGEFDEDATRHWDADIEAYLPSDIAHLFFFDGEQVSELADVGRAGVILGTAIRSLLGMDLVDRLESDLRAFERRKKSEGASDATSRRIVELQAEREILDRRLNDVLVERGRTANETGRAEKLLEEARLDFRGEGGELFEQRTALERELAFCNARGAAVRSELRSLVASSLFLGPLCDVLGEVLDQARREHRSETDRASAVVLEARDQEFLASEVVRGLPSTIITQLEGWLNQDRALRNDGNANFSVVQADGNLVAQLDQLLSISMPADMARSEMLLKELDALEARREQIERDLERAPTSERIAQLQDRLKSAELEHAKQKDRSENLEQSIVQLRKELHLCETALERALDEDMEKRAAESDRLRMLEHSKRVRSTLTEFRSRVVAKQLDAIEREIFECLTRLLRKSSLVTGLKIDPHNFTPTLLGADGHPIGAERLSAGERQLLATAMLWGLARVSGRPVPMIIDTPLGRLDSSHRRNLVDHYFPHASHQVILLSTDEEIVGSAAKSLQSRIAATYTLAHDTRTGSTKINSGYFE